MKTLATIALALSITAMLTATDARVVLFFAAMVAFNGYLLVKDSKARKQCRIKRALERDFGYLEVRKMMDRRKSNA